MAGFGSPRMAEFLPSPVAAEWHGLALTMVTAWLSFNAKGKVLLIVNVASQNP